MPPSLTAQGVARARALMTRGATAHGDPDGEARLNADLVGDVPNAPGLLFGHLVARTRFFDDLTLATVEGGTTQVVIVGAGYDARALRFREPGVRFFEVDLPETQADKHERLSRLMIDASDITFVPLDLTDGDIDVALASAGHDAASRSLFIGEGLLLYLDRAVIEHLFAGLRRRAAGAATLALSLSVRDATASDPTRALRRSEWYDRLREIGEPPRTTLARDEWEALLGATGWTLASAVDPHSIEPGVPSGGALLVTAIPSVPR
jgi:methyltransferase (TIGR00027 family)